MKSKLIYLIEDVKKIQEYNKLMLEEEGFTVETAMTLAAARALLAKRQPDVIVLDRGMPDGEGLDLLRELRAEGIKTPVLVLTGHGHDKEQEVGFDAGCDDYMPKPYTFGVLHKRLLRLLKSAEEVPERISSDALTMDVLSGQAFLRGVDLALKPKEFALLLLFVQNKNKMMEADYIYEKVWDAPLIGSKNALHTAISNLKKKLALFGEDIETERGVGYIYRK
jgi:DNA-binding response OmpR family regulator